MKIPCRLSCDEGSVLVVSLIILVLLTLIGISASRTASIEIRIAGNERSHQVAFYRAEGGLEAGTELLELNIACPQGFTSNGANGEAVIENAMVVEPSALSFWLNTSASTPSDGIRDIYMPNAYNAGQAHTNLNVGGSTFMSVGGSIQMAAGYEGIGKGLAGGGAFILYDILSQHQGSDGSEAVVMLQWRHLIGQEGECKY